MLKTSGHIVTISSVLGTAGGNKLSEYSSSKFGSFGLAESLRLELLDQYPDGKVNTTIICPYLIDTGMFEGIKQNIPPFVKMFLPPLKPVEVATRILLSIHRNEPVVFMPDFFWSNFLLRVLFPPRVVDSLQQKTGALSAMNHFVGRAPRTDKQ
eukprot:TRINITY_DN9996_c0_g1_i3.p1 TRINITY_DN9996_c0_g1~~TRINITY_DN9996_c0_g1_i3.p1  ORF type:complete len:154 (-),score=27.01 TRINITY_DN9996_c0_g1_i3:114-575(-)